MAQFMTIDISNSYLITSLKRPEYICVCLTDLPDEIIGKYHLDTKTNANGIVFIKVTKSMHSLPQAGFLANELFKKRLNKHWYC